MLEVLGDLVIHKMSALSTFVICTAVILTTTGCVSGGESYIGHYRVEVTGQNDILTQQALVRQVGLEIAAKLGRKIDFDIADQRQIQVIMKAEKMASQTSIVLTSRWVKASNSEFAIDFAKQGRNEDEIVTQTKSAIESVLSSHASMKWEFGVTSWSYAK